MANQVNPPREAALSAGYDEEDPYADTEIDELPAWWRENVNEFREHGFRPYRPPRFADGELVPPLVQRLERELETTIRIRKLNPTIGEDWEIWVDDEPIAEVGRTRDETARTVYDMSADVFTTLIKESVKG